MVIPLLANQDLTPMLCVCGSVCMCLWMIEIEGRLYLVLMGFAII